MPGGLRKQDRIVDLLETWETIGDHRTGTAGDRLTSRWLADLVRGAGLDAEEQGFPFRRRIVRAGWVELAGTRIEGVPQFDGGETVGILDTALRPLDAAGGIGVGRAAVAELDADTRDFLAARASARHDALVVVSSGRSVEPGLVLANAEDYRQPRALPVLQVGTAHGEPLREAAKRGERARLAIGFDVEETEAFNVQTRVAGRQPGLAPLVVMTPRSGWWRCTAERGGGIVVWVEALRRLATERPLRDVIFTASTGHELGHVGLDAWLARTPEILRTAYAWVHLGANFATHDSALRLQASDQALLDLGVAFLAGRGLTPTTITPPGTRPFGEARNVFDGGGRYVSLLGTNRWFHHPDDRLARSVDVARTGLITAALCALIESLANSPA